MYHTTKKKKKESSCFDSCLSIFLLKKWVLESPRWKKDPLCYVLLADGMDGIEIGLHGFGAKLNLRGSNKA